MRMENAFGTTVSVAVPLERLTLVAEPVVPGGLLPQFGAQNVRTFYSSD
jgi:hypothetical protein